MSLLKLCSSSFYLALPIFGETFIQAELYGVCFRFSQQNKSLAYQIKLFRTGISNGVVLLYQFVFNFMDLWNTIYFNIWTGIFHPFKLNKELQP